MQLILTCEAAILCHLCLSASRCKQGSVKEDIQIAMSLHSSLFCCALLFAIHVFRIFYELIFTMSRQKIWCILILGRTIAINYIIKFFFKVKDSTYTTKLKTLKFSFQEIVYFFFLVYIYRLTYNSMVWFMKYNTPYHHHYRLHQTHYSVQCS